MADQCCNSKDSGSENNKEKKSCCGSEQKQDSCNTTVETPTISPKKTDCCASSDSKASSESNSSCCSGLPKQAFIPLEDISVKHSNSNHSLTDNYQRTFRIYGMDCAACAKTIEKGVATLPQMQQVQVNFSTGKMKVQSDSLDAFTPIESMVEKLGFTAESLEQNNSLKTYNVEGMDCSSCTKSIENHLMTLPEVSQVQVNFSSGKMKVAHTLPEDTLFAEVEKIGFKAFSPSIAKEDAPNKLSKDTIGMIASSVLIVTGFIGTYLDILQWIPTILFALVIAISGYKPLRSAFYAIKSKSLDMNVLMSGAAIGAMLIGEWFEGATVVWLFAIGTYLQTRSLEKTRKSISNLMDLAPAEAWVKVEGTLVKKDVAQIRIGNIIVIKPGEKIPLDGEIILGESSINQAPITGESIPIDKQVGDPVYAGTINEHGTLDVKVTKLVEDTTIAKIIHLVEEAQEKKAPTEAFVDKFASIYTPIVFIAALSVIIIPPLFGFGSTSEWFYKGLELLIVACPCALVISTPVAIVSAIGNAAENGVLIKGGTFLEIAGKIDAVAFDKTGTLTKGKPTVSNVVAFDLSEQELLSIAYTLEDYSIHPIAKSVLAYAKEQGITKLHGTDFKNLVGKGVEAFISNTRYFAGNKKLFEELNVSLNSINQIVLDLQQSGKTVVIVGTEQKILGIIAVSDQIRPETAATLDKLTNSNVAQTVMLTGDNDGTAEQIAKEAHIGRYFANLLPEDKVTAIQKLQGEGYRVAMVGDGINDAPALATADLGIAMGGAGTDTAMETADIVLMADNLDKLPHTMKLSRKALAIIKQNIIFSIMIKVIALALIFPGWLTLWMAVLSDTGAALLVIINSLRLLKFKD